MVVRWPEVLHCEAWRDGDGWVAESLEIAIAAQGQSLDEARTNLDDALNVYFETYYMHNAEFKPIGRVPYYFFRLLWWHVHSLWLRLFGKTEITWTREITKHRWSGWPGAYCLDCGLEDPRYWICDAEGHPPGCKRPECQPGPCPCPGEGRHDPYRNPGEEDDPSEEA